MRIGLLTTSFPRFDGDIPGFFVLGFAQALARQGHHVEVLAPEPSARKSGPPRFSGLDVHWVSYLWPQRLQQTFYGAGVLDNLQTNPLAALGLAPFPLRLYQAAKARERTWDALVSHWALPSALVAGALRNGRPHLSVLHSADVALLERLPGRAALARRIVEGSTQLLFTSQDLRRRFAALLGPLGSAEHAGNMHVCAMGIEPAQPHHERPKAPSAQSGARAAFSVLSLGRLVPIKGLEHAIDAVRGLRDTELIIAGDGPHRSALEAYARGAPVRFVGELRGQEKVACFQAADAFLLPSLRLDSGRTEGMPTTLLEAMQYGLPVVASAVGGIPDVVEHGRNGLLVAPASSADIERALTQLQDSPSLRAELQTAARETASHYVWDELGPHFSELLREGSGG